MTTTVAISKDFLLLKCFLLTGKKWYQDRQMIESSASYCQWKEFHSENSQDNSSYQIAGWWVSLKENIRCSSLNRLTIPQLREKMTINFSNFTSSPQELSAGQIFVWIYNSWIKNWKKKSVSEQYNQLHHQEQLLSHTHTCNFSWHYCYIKM